MNYDACIKTICGGYVTELNDNKLFKQNCLGNFLYANTGEESKNNSCQSSKDLSGLNIENEDRMSALVLDQIVREMVKTKQQ